MRWVSLAAVAEPEQVVPTLALALGLGEGAASAASLGAQLRDRRMLLVLDNLEHVVAVAPDLGELLAAAPHVMLLVTSRIALRVAAEHRYPVPPLSPDDGVALFAARAAAVAPAFDPADGRAALHEICRRLDGLPLAIELAAARAQILTPAALQRRLGDRLELLTAGARDVPARHRTLRATIAWSWELLDDEERMLLRRLGVFAGGFSLAAARVVDGRASEAGALDGIEALVDQSLVGREDGEDGEPRFALLETIREFARERLAADDDADAARARHAGFFAALADRGASAPPGAQQRAWLVRLRADHANLREALAWSLRVGDAPGALRLAHSLSEFWYLHGHYAEGRRWLAGALELAEHGDPGAERADALAAAGRLAFLQCDYGEAVDLLCRATTAYAALRDRRGTASVLQTLGSVARERGELDAAVRHHSDSLRLWVALATSARRAARRTCSRSRPGCAGRVREATELAEGALLRARRVGDDEQIAWALLNLAAVALGDEHADRARRRAREALAISREIGYREGVAWSFDLLGRVARAEGHVAEAIEHLRISLDVHHELGDRWRCASVLEALAGLDPDPWRGARLVGAAEALREAIGTPPVPAERPAHERALCALREALGAELLTRLREEGAGLTLARALESARDGGDAAAWEARKATRSGR